MVFTTQMERWDFWSYCQFSFRLLLILILWVGDGLHIALSLWQHIFSSFKKYLVENTKEASLSYPQEAHCLNRETKHSLLFFLDPYNTNIHLVAFTFIPCFLSSTSYYCTSSPMYLESLFSLSLLPFASAGYPHLPPEPHQWPSNWSSWDPLSPGQPGRLLTEQKSEQVRPRVKCRSAFPWYLKESLNSLLSLETLCDLVTAYFSIGLRPIDPLFLKH